MKNIFKISALIILSIVLIYLSLFIGELITSILFVLGTAIYVYIRRRNIKLYIVVTLLSEAILILFSFNIVSLFDKSLQNIFEIKQVYPVKPTSLYRSYVISIENISSINPINAAEIYLFYDRNKVEVLDVKPLDEFLKITLSNTNDENKGLVYIAGGLPNPGYSSKKALFAQLIVLLKGKTSSDLIISSKSRILANDGSGTSLSTTTNGPYFRLEEVPTTNPIATDSSDNTRQEIAVDGVNGALSRHRINLLIHLLLKLNSIVLEK